MTQNYTRVLPRDLFNEANLLKCIGKLVLLIEDGLTEGITYHYDGDPFCICQDESSGALYVANINFFVEGGRKLDILRPLNSREPWPIYIETGNDSYEVFNSIGKLSICNFKMLDR